MQQKLAEDAERAGMSVQEFVEKVKAAQIEAQRQAAIQQQQQTATTTDSTGSPNPAAIALAIFSRVKT
ncbi:hypothetical protein DID88_005812 [Monilinia fructigena]|uniref:Uncharacterized protein n=1 Tax=Monilinia fructigena TaxID=38457 RepID=A0A395J0V9_9HELO|nr:hypothetical protein DID88_005812 [Monilinia fructigena]